MNFVRTSTVAALVSLFAGASAVAAPAPHEGFLVSAADALAYCKAGKLKAGAVAYINGSGGLAQFGPGTKCAQKVPAGRVKTALVYKGTAVSSCPLAGPATAVSFCNSGAMGTYDIDYINGKVGLTISGPGYGCPVGTSTSGIGNALCN